MFDQVMQLNAIWLNKKVQLGDGRETKRVTQGDLVRIENDELVNCGPGMFTHEVLECRGKMYSDFSLTCFNLVEEKIEVINL